MARRDPIQIPSTQRNLSRNSIDLDATTKQASYLRSPPRTPPSHTSRAAKGKGRAKAPRARPAIRDTFRSDDARGGFNEHHRVGSDSHDLSWSPRQTRDSVVDNMLLSLDQLFVPGNPPKGSTNVNYSAVEELDPYSSPRYKFSRRRGHTISSSLSSEHDFPTAENSSHNSNRPSRGHRSNSSSNFPSALRRIDSLYADDGGKKNIRGRLYETQRAAAPGERPAANRSHEKSGSKSSISSSLDLGQVLGGSRWQPAFERRSSIIDLGTEKRGGVTSGFSGMPRSAFSTSWSKELDYNDLEAAPTPTVPAGPRSKNRSPAKAHLSNLPSHAFPLPKTPSSRQTWPDRVENSTKKGRKVIDERAMHDTNIKSSLQNGLNAHGPDANVSSAHKPSSTYASSSALPSKERPGFFKRVFGSSSRNVTPTSNDASSSQKGLASSKDSTRADSRAGQVSEAIPGAKQPSAPSTGDAAAIDSKELPQVPLNKKTSFFRRRKKSMSGDAPLPILPPELQNQLYGPTVTGVDASPVSSLRKVMDPYLNSPNPPHHHRDQLLEDHAGKYDIAYLAGYAARNESSKRPGSNTNRSMKNDPEAFSNQRNFTSPMCDNPKARDHTSDDFNQIPGDSFLHDSSGNEGKADVDEISDMSSAKKDNGHEEEALVTDSVSRGDIVRPRDEKESVTNKIVNDNGDLTKVGELTPTPPVSSPKRDGSTSDFQQEVYTPKKVNLKDWNSPRISPSAENIPSKPSSQHSTRIWLAPTNSEENFSRPNGGHIQLGTTERSASVSNSEKGGLNKTPLKPSSTANCGNQESEPSEPKVYESQKIESLALETETSNETSFTDSDQPTDVDRAQAKKIFDGEDPHIDKSKAAPWLGEPIPERVRIREAYMELFHWQNLDILASLRGLCGRILLKGETQQVDRIIQSFSNRWCQCNPDHGFKATGTSCTFGLSDSVLNEDADVVHAICYSILMLNTDLHMAGIENKMTRTQYLRNMMPTLKRIAADAAPGGFEVIHSSIIPSVRGQLLCSDPPSPPRTSSFSHDHHEERPSFEGRRPTYRLSMRPSDDSGQEVLLSSASTPLEPEPSIDDCGPLVKTPFYGKLSAWEIQIETVLKGFYNSVRARPLPLFGSDEELLESMRSANGFSTLTNNMLRRTPSMVSKAGSEAQTMRGRFYENRLGTGRWTSKTRSRPRLYPASTVPSSRTSFDDQYSIMSPSGSSNWSRYSLVKTQTSMSVHSFASDYPHGDYKQSIGFANALSQAFIREESSGYTNLDDNAQDIPLLEDENLELAGAPWAKEGILKYKYHLESTNKKAKSKNWVECFVVVEKGWVRLFQFGMNAKSVRQKARNQKAMGGVVGGGNWAENAEVLGSFLLRQTIASILPEPGYSKIRPYVWALSLPTGAVHLFQAGTPEIVKEFVASANYWSARLSKEPLVGGVSNVEYGWSDLIVNTALLPIENRPSSNNNAGPRPSIQSSIRSSTDQGSTRPKLPGDKILISDWTPPQQSMMASALKEEDQLKGLKLYVSSIEEDIRKHTELRSLMFLAVSTDHSKSHKFVI